MDSLAVFFIGNPIMDITVDDNDSVLHSKYKLEKGMACLASDEQMPIYDEVYNAPGRKVTPGGSALNSARAANHYLRQKDLPGKIAYAGCIGADEKGEALV